MLFGTISEKKTYKKPHDQKMPLKVEAEIATQKSDAKTNLSILSSGEKYRAMSRRSGQSFWKRSAKIWDWGSNSTLRTRGIFPENLEALRLMEGGSWAFNSPRKFLGVELVTKNPPLKKEKSCMTHKSNREKRGNDCHVHPKKQSIRQNDENMLLLNVLFMIEWVPTSWKNRVYTK